MIIKLTPEQIEAIAPAYRKIGEMADEGKPGLLLAQVYGDHIRVGIISHENGVKMLEALGSDPTRTHRSAYELKAQNAEFRRAE